MGNRISGTFDCTVGTSRFSSHTPREPHQCPGTRGRCSVEREPTSPPTFAVFDLPKMLTTGLHTTARVPVLCAVFLAVRVAFAAAFAVCCCLWCCFCCCSFLLLLLSLLLLLPLLRKPNPPLQLLTKWLCCFSFVCAA